MYVSTINHVSFSLSLSLLFSSLSPSLPLPSSSLSLGDWVSGKKEGRGEEQSQYGQYKGGWKADMKQGVGEERTLVGTIFEGSWDKGRKHGRGVRKMIFGSVDEQVGIYQCGTSIMCNNVQYMSFMHKSDVYVHV